MSWIESWIVIRERLQPCSQCTIISYHPANSLRFSTLSSLYPTNTITQVLTNQSANNLPSFLPSFHSIRFLQNRLLVPPFAFKQSTQHRRHRFFRPHRFISMLQTISQQPRQRGLELLLQLLPDQFNHRLLSLRQRSIRSTRLHCPALARIARGS